MISEAAHLAIMELAKGIALDETHADDDWTAISLVIGRQQFKSKINLLHGYVYLADGTWKSSQIRIRFVNELCKPLIAATVDSDDDPGWVSCLFQIQRPSGETNVEFEREDPDRWELDLADLDALPRRLRPEEPRINFDELVEPMGGKCQDRYWPLTEAQIAEVEAAVGWTLPADLREFLLRHGVAYAKGSAAFVSDDDEIISFSVFYGAPDGRSSYSIVRTAGEFAPMLTFASGDAGIFLMDADGQVWFESHAGRPEKIASSFTDFCQHIKQVE